MSDGGWVPPDNGTLYLCTGDDGEARYIASWADLVGGLEDEDVPSCQADVEALLAWGGVVVHAGWYGLM